MSPAHSRPARLVYVFGWRYALPEQAATRPEQNATAIASAAARRDQLSRFLLLGCRRIGTESRLLERGANRGGGCTLGNCRRETAGDVSFDGAPRWVWRVVSCVFTR
jgi:hypothetical protein